MNNKENAEIITNALKDINTGEDCDYGILCEKKEVEIKDRKLDVSESYQISKFISSTALTMMITVILSLKY